MHRERSSFYCCFLFVALASPLMLCAQFRAPTDEELKMISDPKAPGAAAVYLYREETMNAYGDMRTIYARIKVLTDKGKELATVKLPFLHGFTMVDKVEGRTIHSDGTVIPLTVKPEDLVDFKIKDLQEDNLVFTLPSVEAGSILEYRVNIRYAYGAPLPIWELQSPYFIHTEHFVFRPGMGGMTAGARIDEHGRILNRLAAVTTPQKAPVTVQQKDGAYIVDLSDVPPVTNEDWMPPTNTIQWREEFYFTYAHSAKEFWDAELKLWAKDTEEFTKVAATIKKAANGLTTANDPDEQKARKIYAAVAKLENTDFTRVKSEAERKKEKLKEVYRVEDVWKNQSGTGNSIALLYVALARAAGLKVWPMQVVDRSNAMFDSTYLNKDQLEDYIAIVDLGGKEVFVDPGQKVCPFGVLHWAHALSVGFRESETGPIEAATPASTFAENA